MSAASEERRVVKLTGWRMGQPASAARWWSGSTGLSPPGTRCSGRGFMARVLDARIDAVTVWGNRGRRGVGGLG